MGHLLVGGSGLETALAPLVFLATCATTPAAHLDCEPNPHAAFVLPLPAGVAIMDQHHYPQGEGPITYEQFWTLRAADRTSAELLSDLVAHYSQRGWQLRQGPDAVFSTNPGSHSLEMRTPSPDVKDENEVDVTYRVHMTGVFCVR
jgi:hypothetical protein